MIEFDQLTQYVIMENGVPVVKDLEQTETTEPETLMESVPYVPELTIEEKVAEHDIEIASIEETMDVLFGGV